MSIAAPIRWGLLGTGNITAKLLAGAAASERARVVAVGSRSAEVARAFADANGIDRAHGSYEALLADAGVDAVYISLPNALHHRWTMIALAAGKHVLCEKPYTRHPEEVDVAWDAAEASGLVLQEAFMWRHTPQAVRLRELLPRLGELVAVRATFSFPLADDSNIRVNAELEGGALMDVGCYCVSGSRYVAGEEPELVFGQQVTTPAGVDRRFTALLRFPTGLTATFHTNFDAQSESLEVIGREGTVYLPDPWHSTRGLLIVDGVEERVEPKNPYGCELDDMAAAIRGERPPRLSRADALGQARTIAALYQSAASGEAVKPNG